MDDFDPDKYLAATEPTPTAAPTFDPEEYLKATAPKPKQQSGVEAATAYGQKLGAPTIQELAKTEQQFSEEHPYIYGAAKAVASMVPTSVEQIKQMTTLPRPSQFETKDLPESQYLGEAWRGEHGPVAQAESIVGTALQALPLTGLLFAKSPLQPSIGDLALVDQLKGAQPTKPTLSQTLGFEKPEPPLPTASELTPEVAATNEGLSKLEQPTTEGAPNAIQEPVSTQPYGVRAEPQVPQETQAPAASVGSERVPEVRQGAEVPGGTGQEVAPETGSGPVSERPKVSDEPRPLDVGGPRSTDTYRGVNAAGEHLYTTAEGQNYRLRNDRKADHARGRGGEPYRDYGGDLAPVDTGTQPVSARLLPGEKQGDLISSTQQEPFALVGEKAAPGTHPTEIAETTAKTQAAEEARLKAEHEQGLLDDLQEHQQRGGDELVDAIKSIGGVKADSPNFKDLTEEFNKKAGFSKLVSGENVKYNDIFRKDAIDDDKLVLRLQQKGFDIENAGQLKDLLDERFRTGKKVYGSEARAVSLGQQSFGLPSEYALGATHPAPNFIKSIADYFVNNSPSQIWNGIKGSLDATLGKTFAKTTIADRESGELGAKWISSRIAAPHLADTFSAQVLEGTGVDPVKFGAALTEDNLRSVRASAETPEAAANVTSVIGAKNSPFKTEAEYQSFLNDPATQTALEKHRALWEQTVDPMFRKAQSLDPDEPLPTRGDQTGARINLFNDIEGRGKNVVSGGRAGSLTATMRRKSPFAIRATGSGQNYNVNYNDMMTNTFGRQLEIANKNAFEDRLVETGNAVISKPGPAPVLPDGEATVGFPLKRKASSVFTNAEGQPQTVPINQNIYVRKSLAGEYRRGADVDLIHVPGVVKAFNNVVNKTALAGLTDASVHVLNLGTALFTKPGVVGSVFSDSLLSAFGRADIPVTITKTLVKSFKDNRAQMAQLAEIGAGRGEFPTHNPLGKVIQVADKTTRLVLDDAYQNMVRKGWVVDTPTNRREFVNQVGQYNKRAQGDLRRLARDSGLGPFATAGTTFNVLGLRTMGLSPGVKATSPMAAAALRANVLSKWVGAATFVGAMNYLLTKDKGGGVSGRPGVPIGRLDTGLNDKNGNPLSVPVFDLMGLGRGLRVTGARGFIESQRKGLTLQNSFDAAARDVFNSSISPFAGPPVRFGIVAATGSQPAINVGRVSKVVPPGESQSQENLKQAIIDANPVVKSVELAREPGQGAGAAIRQQLPRLSLLPSQGADFIAKYPEIVRKAQARDYVNDVIRRARRMNPEDKQAFLDESLKKLAPEDQKNAIRTFKYSRVMGNTPKRNVGATPYVSP